MQDFKNDLSADSKIRLEKNPLRILDSKDQNDQKILVNAPSLKDCLNESSKSFFNQVLEGLKALNIPFEVSDKLVRGIDYYTHTVFEFVTTDLGAQGTILAGGRYDGLIEQMGGPQTSGVGWASGMERLALMISPDRFKTNSKIIAVIAADDIATTKCLQISQSLRARDFQVEMPLSGNMGKKMKRANKIGAAYSIIVGSTEIEQQTLTIKNLGNGEQKTIPESELSTVQFN